MVSSSQSRAPLHIQARRRLARYATRARFPDGWLPPERVLCEELEISRGTLRKALAHLIQEGRVVSLRPKGNYIVERPHKQSIGVLLGDGSLADTCVAFPGVLSGVLQELATTAGTVRMLQLREPERVLDVVWQYDLDGVIWCNPTSQTGAVIRQLQESQEVPLVVPNMNPAIAGQLDPRTTIAIDHEHGGRNVASYLIDAGHRRIAYLGDVPDFISYRTFVQTLNEAGISFREAWHIPEIDQIANRLPELLAREGITAITSNGGYNRLEALFSTLETADCHPELELVVDKVPGMEEICARHPSVKVAAYRQRDQHELGTQAVRLLLNLLQGRRPSDPILLKTTIERQTAATQAKKPALQLENALS